MLNALPAIVVVVALSILYRSAMQTNYSGDWPTGLVAYGNPFRYLVCVFWLVTLGFFILGYLNPPDTRADLIGAVCVWAGFVGLTLVLHLEAFGVKIELHDSAITTTSPWRRNRKIGWHDITGVTFSPSSQWYIITTRKDGKIRCHTFLGGLKDLLANLKAHGHTIGEDHPYAGKI